MLEFKGDAICLSGVTGTKLKSEIIREYYPLWWNIVSGGDRLKHRHSTAIIELNAATGEVYIENTKETLLGSAGHALKLKFKDTHKTRHLNVFLVEEYNECFVHLLNVLKRRWDLPKTIGYDRELQKSSKIHLFNLNLDKAILELENYKFKHGLYFFDPLLFVEWEKIETVAKNRIKYPFETATEFIIFVFTSDWIIGRGEFAPLPNHKEESDWTLSEKETVHLADEMFGETKWKEQLLIDSGNEEKEEILVKLYKNRLHRWFRYILPLPFKPKPNQTYHLFFCSNYVDGIKATRYFYYDITNNPKYAPDNKQAYDKFKKLYPEMVEGFTGKKKPDEWKCLWQLIRYHEDGYCDERCKNIEKNCSDDPKKAIKWLLDQNYIEHLEELESAWDKIRKIPRYKINWKTVKSKLNINPPKPLIPVEKVNNIKPKKNDIDE